MQSISSDSIKILQITDTHLFSSDEGSLLSVNTAHSFHAVMNELQRLQSDFDYILATGDISQDHTRESYQYFIDQIKPLNTLCYWLPGNHDYCPHMQLPDNDQILYQEHVLLGDSWQMIMLNSQVEGVPYGHISDDQLAMLTDKLQQYPDRYTLVILHHHPVLVDSHWLDQHALQNPEPLWNVLSQYKNVRLVLCGHIHQEMTRQVQCVQVMASPSTCVQFKPHSQEFALDAKSPGWREITLHSNGEIDTQVKRLPNGYFHPDFSSNGY